MVTRCCRGTRRLGHRRNLERRLPPFVPRRGHGTSEAYYRDYAGTPQELISAIRHGHLYQGQWNARQAKPRGRPSANVSAANFVHFLQNHDQVANSAAALRTHLLTTPGRHRALTALLLLGPQTPMLFMGQEFSASNPFYYFADHEPELAKLVSAAGAHSCRSFRGWNHSKMNSNWPTRRRNVRSSNASSTGTR